MINPNLSDDLLIYDISLINTIFLLYFQLNLLILVLRFFNCNSRKKFVLKFIWLEKVENVVIWN